MCDLIHKLEQLELSVKHILSSCFDQEGFYRLLA